VLYKIGILYIKTFKLGEKAGNADNFLWDIQERYDIMKSHQGTLFRGSKQGGKRSAQRRHNETEGVIL
jgi:hypothetical protein